MVRREGMQLQFIKVGNVKEEGSRHIGDAIEAKGFEGGWTYDIRESIFHFNTKVIPIQKVVIRIPIKLMLAQNNREAF